jgi:FAD:protein FMN transferase
MKVNGYEHILLEKQANSYTDPQQLIFCILAPAMNTITYRNMFSMGTRLDIVFPGLEDEMADRIFAAIKEGLNQIEDKISIYREQSEFSLINQIAPKRPCSVSDQVFNMIRHLVDLSVKTSGYFDFTLGMIGKEHKPNTDAQYYKDDFLKLPVDKKILLDAQSQTVKINGNNVMLDSGAFGKGLGLDMMKKTFEQNKITSAFVNFGNSSVLGFGNHPYGDSWKTGIASIFDENENVFAFDLKNTFMSVSGNTPQNLRKNEGGHIIHPRTGKPVAGYFQCAISGENGLISEVLSTALTCAPDNERDSIMDNFPGYKAVFIEYDNQNKPNIIYTRNI